MPQEVGKIIPKTVHALGREFEREYRSYFAMVHWSDVVGKYIALNAKAVAVDDEVLVIYSADSSWKNELWMRKAEILQKFNNIAGEKVVKDLRFVTRMDKLPLADEKTERIKRKVSLVKVQLNDKERQYVKDTCSDIEDNGLRNTFARLMLKQKKLMPKKYTPLLQTLLIAYTKKMMVKVK